MTDSIEGVNEIKTEETLERLGQMQSKAAQLEALGKELEEVLGMAQKTIRDLEGVLEWR